MSSLPGGKDFLRQERIPVIVRYSYEGEPMAAEDQIRKFWSEKEDVLGGKVQFQTYATFLGEAGSDSFNGRGGLFYIIGDCLYFEDFEKHNALMALFNRKDDDYEKTELSFPLEEILEAQKVSEKDARACIRGGMEEDRLPTLSKFQSFFARGYWRLAAKGRRSLFFEIMDDKALLELLPSLQSR
jgi:hypothetical protein